MMERKLIAKSRGRKNLERKSRVPDLPKRSYFASTVKQVETFTSGCGLLDCVLGGGYAVGRMVNIVGDKSSGKTLMAIEASANFRRIYPQGRIRYVEVEAAFDTEYARALGMPVDTIEFPDTISTIEDLFEDLEDLCKTHLGKKDRVLYVVDSYDALSDRAELGRKIDEGSYGGNKAKQGSQLFRRIVQELEESNITLMLISQVRDNIGVMFGAKHSRSGGHALDFYASQVLWLAEKSKLDRTVRGVKRVYGVQVIANCKKNKVGLPFRQCTYPIVFGYGVDDIVANLDWLKEVKRLDVVNMSESTLKRDMEKIQKLPDREYTAFRKELDAAVRVVWSEIEDGFLPKRSKY